MCPTALQDFELWMDAVLTWICLKNPLPQVPSFIPDQGSTIPFHEISVLDVPDKSLTSAS